MRSFPTWIPESDTLIYISVNRYKEETGITEAILSELNTHSYSVVAVTSLNTATVYTLASQTRPSLP